jgi:hypothetical protein
MTLVDGQGCKKTLDSADELLAGKTSLGVLGVVLEYTVEVQEMSFCRVQNIFEMRLKVCLCMHVCQDHIVANFPHQEMGTPMYAHKIRKSLVQPRPFLASHTPFYLHILLSRQAKSCL